MMENEANIILEQYRIYTESKDKFIDRSFQTNRHYFLVLCGLCIVLVLFKQFFPNIAIIFSLLLSFRDGNCNFVVLKPRQLFILNKNKIRPGA